MIRACEVLLPSDDPALLDIIDAYLASHADEIRRTRKGRVWDVVIKNILFYVSASESPDSILLSCPGGREATEILRGLAEGLAGACGGLHSEPE